MRSGDENLRPLTFIVRNITDYHTLVDFELLNSIFWYTQSNLSYLYGAASQIPDYDEFLLNQLVQEMNEDDGTTHDTQENVEASGTSGTKNDPVDITTPPTMTAEEPKVNPKKKTSCYFEPKLKTDNCF